MTFRARRSESVRHVLLRAGDGEVLPDGLVAALRQENVTCGWLRGSGVLEQIALRAYASPTGSLGGPRILAGPLQVLTLEGSIGAVEGTPTCSLRAVLARETDRGLETIAGEIESARVVALEVVVTAFDDLALERVLDEAGGVWLLGPSGGLAGANAPPRAAAKPGPRPPAAAGGPAASGWAAALEASADAQRAPPRAHPVQPPVVPVRPARADVDFDAPFPEPGDKVEHFAFGRCDVVRSDGDRLHLKVHKDGRIREIALEMLRVIPLSDGQSDDTQRPRRFKLERKI